MQISRVLSALFATSLLAATPSPPPSSPFFQTVGRDALRTGVAPGIAVAVVLHGAIVYEGGFGEADVSEHIPVTAHTPFSIGSLTKQFTAAAILLLVQERRVALDDPLSKYVPSLPNASRMTIRMLLNQTSGLHNYPLLSEHAWPTQGHIPLAKIVAILATDPTDFKPGTKLAYSNANYAALAAVVEKAGGEPFGAFLEKHIFGPLDMKDSGFGYAAQRRGNLAVGYANGAAERPALGLDLYSGACGIVASADDLARWDISLMRASLLPQPMIAQMWNTGRLIGGQSVPYGMGWVPATVDGTREVWHNGLAPGVGGYCYNAIFPDRGLAVVVLTNGFSAGGVPERMVQRIAAAYEIGTPPEIAPAATPAAGDDPSIDALARSFWDQLGSGSVDRNHLTAQFAALLTPQFAQQVRQGVVSLGQLESFTFVGKDTANGATAYRYQLTFASGVEHEWDIWVMPDGKIAGSRLVR